MRDDFDESPIRVPPQVFLLKDLGAAALRVLCALFRFLDKSMWANPGRDKLFRYLPDHDVRNFRRAIRELEAKGYLKLSYPKNNRTGASEKVEYTVTLPSLKKIREEIGMDTSALGGVTSTPRRVSNVVVSGSPNRYELKSKATKRGYPAKRPTGLRRGKIENRADAVKALEFFKTRFKARTGKAYESDDKNLDLYVMDTYVRTGSLGLHGAMAAIESWFNTLAPWAEEAKKRGYRLAGRELGMERFDQQIQALPSFPEACEKFKRELYGW